MRPPGRPKVEFPLGGIGRQAEGCSMRPPGRPKVEFLLGGTGRRPKGAP